jgi:hypothetical protein
VSARHQPAAGQGTAPLRCDGLPLDAGLGGGFSQLLTRAADHPRNHDLLLGLNGWLATTLGLYLLQVHLQAIDPACCTAVSRLFNHGNREEAADIGIPLGCANQPAIVGIHPDPAGIVHVVADTQALAVKLFQSPAEVAVTKQRFRSG